MIYQTESSGLGPICELYLYFSSNNTCLTRLYSSLEELPFPDDSFDFVRICGLGLAVPEDRVRPLLLSSLICP